MNRSPTATILILIATISTFDICLQASESAPPSQQNPTAVEKSENTKIAEFKGVATTMQNVGHTDDSLVRLLKIASKFSNNPRLQQEAVLSTYEILFPQAKPLADDISLIRRSKITDQTQTSTNATKQAYLRVEKAKTETLKNFNQIFTAASDPTSSITFTKPPLEGSGPLRLAGARMTRAVEVKISAAELITNSFGVPTLKISVAASHDKTNTPLATFSGKMTPEAIKTLLDLGYLGRHTPVLETLAKNPFGIERLTKAFSRTLLKDMDIANKPAQDLSRKLSQLTLFHAITQDKGASALEYAAKIYTSRNVTQGARMFLDGTKILDTRRLNLILNSKGIQLDQCTLMGLTY